MKRFIAITMHEYLRESINRDKSRKVLFIDEYGKMIVYDDGDFRIAIDDEYNARYITLWHKVYKKNIESWVRCGYLDASLSRVPFRNGKYLSIRSIEIDKKHRNLGYGMKLYKALFDFSGSEVKGIYSYLPNRVNKKEIPGIYKKLGAVTDGDYQYIDFNN